MRHLFAVLLLCAMTASVHAAGASDWYVVKTANGVYAYDANGIRVSTTTGFKSLSILRKTPDGNNTIIFTIDCRRRQGTFGGAIEEADGSGIETLIMVEGTPDAMPPHAHGWQSAAQNDDVKMAADAACRARAADAVHVDSEQAALDMLKLLSN